jgi:tetratricopeptide (TPR) repeat protein
VSDNSRAKPDGAPAKLRGLALALGALVVLTAALYAPSLGHPFVWDDSLLLEGNPRATSSSAWGTAITSHYLELFSGATRQSAYYRPLSLSVLLVELRLFGDNPTGYRIVHALWHLLNGVLLFFAARRLLAERSASARSGALLGGALAAALFIALPYAADTVLFLTDVGDPMVLTALLLAAFAFESLRNSGRLVLAAAVGGCTLAGLLCKETAIAIPAVIAVQHLLRRTGASDRHAAIGIAASGLALAAYLVLRGLVIGGGLDLSVATAATRYPEALAAALRFAIAPYPLVLEQRLGGEDALIWTVAGALSLVAAVAAIVLLRRRYPEQIAAGVAWILIVSPSLLAPTDLPAFAPRYLYVPAAALVLLLAPVLGRRSWPVRAVAVGLVITLGLLTAVRVGTWGDPLTLWSHEVEQDPDRPAALIHLAGALENNGQHRDALAVSGRAATLCEASGANRLAAIARTNRARLLADKLGRPDRAMEELSLAARADGTYADAFLQAGLIHARDRRWDKAEQSFRRARELTPYSIPAATGLAGALAAQGRTAAALAELHRAAELAEGSPAIAADIARKIDIVRQQGQRPLPEDRRAH